MPSDIFNNTTGSISNYPDILALFYWLLFLVLLVLGGVVFYYIYDRLRHYRYRIARSLDFVLLQILVPQEPTKKEEGGKKDPKDLVARASQLFSALYSIKDVKLNKMWYKKGNYMSFEVASFEESIKFYIGIPQGLRSIVEKQIHALYPDAFMEEVERYNAEFLKAKKELESQIKNG